MSSTTPRDRFTRELNPEQLRAVTHSGGPCLILAGAGSGKTRVITYRIAWLLETQAVRPDQLCAVTFTNRAAAEMRSRVHELLGREATGLWLLTFHALGLRLLREVAGQPGAPRPGFAVYDRRESMKVWRTVQQQLQVDTRDSPPERLYELCSGAVNRLEDPAGWDELGRPSDQRHAGRVFVPYRAAMARNNALDFDDLLVWPLRLLTSSNPEIRRAWCSRFRHVLVDEYQDTNRLQYRLVRALAGHAELVVVGDEDQAIYRWRGADLANVLDFQSDFEGASVVRLEQNYRSTQPILGAAGSLVAHNRERLGKELWTSNPGDERPLFMLCGSERQEAVWVTKQIAAALVAGARPEGTAVVFRTNAQSRPFEEELAARRIPFRVLGGPTFFRRAEVRDLLSWLRLLVGDDPEALARSCAAPPRGVGQATLEALTAAGPPLTTALGLLDAGVDALAAARALGLGGRGARGVLELARIVRSLRAMLGSCTLPELIEATLESTGYRDLLRSKADGEDRLANLEEVIASASELGADAPADEELVLSFLDRAALVSDAETDRGARAGVTLLTIHSAKGLEFDRVFVAGLEEGLLPHAASVREGQVEEERRLCYVAMTRARLQLFLSAARLRRVQGQERVQTVSRFVAQIDPRLLVVRESPEVVAAGAPASRERVRYTGRAGRRPRRLARPVDPGARGSGTLAPMEKLSTGVGVYHPMFGPGRIVDTQGSGDKLKVSVAFARAGTKQLIASFAKLELLA